MSKRTYKIVKHNGGWAYEDNGRFSATFPTRDAARRAARLAAQNQIRPGESTSIDYDDGRGERQHETADGADRATTEVEG